MSALTLLQQLGSALFLLITVLVFAEAIRRPRRVAADTAFFFGAVALTILIAAAAAAIQLAPRVGGVVEGSLIMAMPYLLLRLVDDFLELPPFVLPVALVGLGASIVALVGLSPTLPIAITLLLVVYFVGFVLYATIAIVRAARRATGVTRRRMQAIAAGSLFLGLDILVAGIQAALPPMALTIVLAPLFGVASGLAYYLGFATPTVLRRAWQSEELRTFLATTANIAHVSEIAAVVSALERGVAVALGVSQAAIGLWDQQRGVLRYHSYAGPGPELLPGEMVSGRAFASQRPIFADDVLRHESADAERYRAANVASVLAAPMTAGDRKIGVLAAYAPRPPLFAADDLSLVELLAQMAAVMLDYVRTYEAASAQVRTEEERDRLRQILEVLPEGVLLVDLDGRIQMINAAALAISRHSRPDETDMSRYDQNILRPDGSRYRAEEAPLARSLLHGEVVVGEQLLITAPPDESPIPILFSSAPLRDSAGKITGGVAAYQDISEIRQLERDKDAFLSSVSHDLKNPLMAISGHVQLLRRRLERTGTLQPAQLTRGFDAIEDATEQMTGMVNELLDVSRLQMGRGLELELQPINMTALVRRLVAMYQRGTDRHRLVVETSEDEIVGTWDLSRLERALGNIISNAVKYSPEGGTTTVTVAQQPRDGGGEAIVTVRDEGIGIPAADLERVFDRFTRASNVIHRFAGSGIGLAGARQIVEQHGGTITVVSVEGVGSTFTVRLPLNTSDDGVGRPELVEHAAADKEERHAPAS